MSATDAYRPSRGPLSRIARRWTAARAAVPLRAATDDFLVSFSFDDVPVSAALSGAECLARHGARATWYVASALVGGDSASGAIIGPAWIRALAAEGHEIALHGHAHADMSRMAPAEALCDIARNRDALAQILGHAPSRHFAYPYGATRPALKRRLPGLVATARGVLPGVNRTGSDAMQLAAFDLRPGPASAARARAGMRRAARGGGWVILFTHDVAPQPSEFGITPRTLEDLVQQAKYLGAEILPVGAVWDRLAAARHKGQRT